MTMPNDRANMLVRRQQVLVQQARFLLTGAPGENTTPEEAERWHRDRKEWLRRLSGDQPFEFAQPSDGSALTLEGAVFQAIGAASMCWERPRRAGVFQSDQAQRIGEALLAFIEAQP